MKSHELVERINNGKIKDGTKFIAYENGKEIAKIHLHKDFNCLVYDLEELDSNVVDSSMLLSNDIEFEIVEEKGWFKPEMREEYWYIEHGHVLYTRWNEECEDLYRYKHHNVFRNPKEAQEYLDYTNALKEAEKPFVYNKDNYYIYYDIEDKKIKLYDVCRTIDQGTTYLGQDEDAVQAFIEKWEKQILKYEFGIFE